MKKIVAQYTLTKVMWTDVQHLLAKKTRWSGTRLGAIFSLWAISCLVVYGLLSLRTWKFHSKTEALVLSAVVSLVVTIAVAWRRQRVDDSFREIFALFEFTEQGVDRTTANTTTTTRWEGFRSHF